MSNYLAESPEQTVPDLDALLGEEGAEPAAGAEVEATASAGSLPELAPGAGDAVNLAALAILIFWTIASASAVVSNARRGARVAASVWAMSFTGSCMLVAYVVWELL